MTDLDRRIFPRNLTARAAYAVRGNPASARPESGVDNTHPGLEFDQRNLDRAFFPGITVEYQFLTGARVVAIDPMLLPPGTPLEADDVGPDEDPVHLLYLYGRFGTNPGQPCLVQLFGLDGYAVLRTVRDLEPGPIMVLIGRRLTSPDPKALPDDGKLLLEYGAIINAAVGKGAAPAVPLPPVRDANNRLIAAMLLGDRAAYLTAEGVIDPAVAAPGGLTHSLCSPWQWDFADCGCHYWAASKPDIVIGEAGGEQVLNFQRDRSRPPPAVPASGYQDWTAGEMTQPAMIAHWETLPMVIAERETDRAPRPAPVVEPEPWTKERVIAELSYLATIEHALAIEYLYAHYSIDAPREPPPKGAPAAVLDRFIAAQLIRQIAVDEMRHLRWVNEALMLLGADISLGRATEFAEGPNTIAGAFELAPLTPERLDYFIAVEAPSRRIDDPGQLDGLYAHLLNSLASGSTELDPPTERRIAEIAKMIIDEGHEHWNRFQQVQKLLSPHPPASWLRVTAPPADLPADHPLAGRLALADASYRDLLAGLSVAFAADPVDRATAILDARQLMYNLDDIGTGLASEGIGMRFALPPVPGDGLKDSAGLAARLADSRAGLHQLAADDPATGQLVARQVARLETITGR